jgi:hypothetical protein
MRQAVSRTWPGASRIMMYDVPHERREFDDEILVVGEDGDVDSDGPSCAPARCI